MPWQAKDATRHSKITRGKPRVAQMWAEVANTELRKTADEGKAVRAANSAVKRFVAEQRKG